MTQWIEGTVVGQTRWTERLFSLRVVSSLALVFAPTHKVTATLGGIVVPSVQTQIKIISR